MSSVPCSIDGCDAKPIARGWCRKHYKRWHKHGDPLHLAVRPLPPQNLPRNLGCATEGCDGKHFAKGLCKRHHSADYYHRNRAAQQETQAAYRATNRQFHRDRTEQWRQENPGRAAVANRAWYEANKVRQLEYARRYRALNLDKVLALNEKRRMRQSSVEVVDLTAEQWEGIKQAWEFACAYCGERPQKLTKDHVIPVSKGGHHTAANIVPACQSCNSRKGDRDAPPFYFQRTA